MSDEMNDSTFENLSTPRRILLVVLRVFSTLVMGVFFGSIVWIVATQFGLPVILTAVLTAGSGLIGAAVGWKWWDKLIDGMTAGL